MEPPKEYALPAGLFEVLFAACARASWTRTHEGLLTGLRTVHGFENLAPSAVQDHFSAQPAQVMEGLTVVAASYRDWAREQLQALGSARQVWAAHAGNPWTLTWRTHVLRYFWLQTGAHPWNGIQLEVVEEQDLAGGPVFRAERWQAPSDAEELLNPPEPGEPRSAPLGTGRYTLTRAVDMEAFFRLGQSLYSARLDRGARRRVIVRPEHGDSFESTMGKQAPQAFRQVWRVQRWFQDWEFSSAGRSGAVAGHRWAFQISDWDSGNAASGRVLDFVPAWAHTAKIAKIQHVHRLSGSALYERLLSIDKRTGAVPFGWYFYMLHGNLVPDTAATRILRAAREGLVDLPDHDVGVLTAWADNPYGF